ncbi:MAG: beta-galactosidase [Victivallales bacterium]|nr:beta-galactosidase [Victivallales bacterium]
MDNLKAIAKVVPVHSSEVAYSRCGIGFEKLDRAVFDPSKAYDKVAALGVKWIRLQSGWARTEKEKGVYDFAWLDDIIDNLVNRGLVPWLCLCYGNGIYDEDAAKIFGAVGCPPIQTDEQVKAWHDYVVALVKRYHGRCEWYEVWNEPDGKWCWKHGPSGTEYGNFVIATAKAIKEADPTAKIMFGSTCLRSIKWLTEVLETGCGKYVDALTYHAYDGHEENSYERVKVLRSLCQSYNPAIQMIQGETGTQSRSDGAGALKGGAWTPLKQAKYLARHMMSDFFSDVMFASYFSCMDMIEALNGTVGDKASYLDYGYFGVLGASFDENGVATGEYTPKPSYYAMQTIASIFREDFSLADLPVLSFSASSPRLLRYEDVCRGDVFSHGFRKPNGSAAYVYWKACELLTTTYESTISFEVSALPKKMELIDLVDGTVYEIPEDQIEDCGYYRKLLHLPLRDYPLLLTFGDFR